MTDKKYIKFDLDEYRAEQKKSPTGHYYFRFNTTISEPNTTNYIRGGYEVQILFEHEKVFTEFLDDIVRGGNVRPIKKERETFSTPSLLRSPYVWTHNFYVSDAFDRGKKTINLRKTDIKDRQDESLNGRRDESRVIRLISKVCDKVTNDVAVGGLELVVPEYLVEEAKYTLQAVSQANTMSKSRMFDAFGGENFNRTAENVLRQDKSLLMRPDRFNWTFEICYFANAYRTNRPVLRQIF